MAGKYTIDQILLNKFFNNQCTDAEKEAVLEWLANPENKLLARQTMEHHWMEVQRSKKDTEVDVERLLAKTQQKIVESNSTFSTGQKETVLQKDKKAKVFSWRMAATWLGILLTISALIFFFADTNDTEVLTDNKKEVKPPSDTEEIKSSSGQIIEKELPDGTKVSLNAQSSLTFPTDFSGLATREVILKGEAFFDVAEDKDHPFIVKTQAVNIVVLGTAFNLKSYEGDPTIETTLIRGKVVIENNKGRLREKVELKPNQKAVFSHATESITLVDVKVKEPTTWNNGSLEFDGDLLYDVIKSLERWYGVTIHVQDKSNMSCQLTARIDKESLGETLEILKSLTGIRYSVVDKDVFIEGKICE